MLLDASEDPELSSLVKNTKGVLFYSVPHRGTFMAEYSINVRYLLFPSIEVRELCKGWMWMLFFLSSSSFYRFVVHSFHSLLSLFFPTDSPALRDLNENFLNIAKEFKILSFAETQPTSIGPMINTLVVPAESAGTWVGSRAEKDAFFFFFLLCVLYDLVQVFFICHRHKGSSQC